MFINVGNAGLRLLLQIVLVMFSCYVWAQGPNGSKTYYKMADGYKGAALKTALSGIIPIPEGRNVGYDGLYDGYKKTDTRPDGYVRDWYSNATNYVHVKDKAGTYKKEGDCYNREHSVPQSWFGGGGIKSDIVHVIPTDGYVNNKRSNYPLGEVDVVEYQSKNGYSKLGSCKTAGYSGKVFEPNDEIKGDMARIYFYMATCYETVAPKWGNGVFSTAYNGFEKWALDMFMRWSKADPVDEREIARNNAVFDVQGNRNPFVDYPGLEDYIWGNKKDVAFSYDNYDGGTVIDPNPGGDDPNPGGDDPNPGGDDPNPGGDDPQPGGDTPVDCEIALGNAFFGTSYGGVMSNVSTDLTGTQNGVTVVYSLGTGSNRYCNDSQIRLYQGNTLTVSVAQDALTEIEFVTANTGKQLEASTGTVRSYSWTGDASSVTFSVNNGSGNLQVTGLRIKVAGGPDIVLGSGDADGDGEVTFMDAVAIVNYLFGNTTQEFNAEAADMNGDGKVTITDAVAVVNAALNSETADER